MGSEAPLTEEQKLYLEGFLRGLRGSNAAIPATEPGQAIPAGPERIHREAQDRFIAAGKALVAEEQAKRSKNPFDMWDEMRANAAEDRFPKGTDVFLHKFHGLFYVAPAQNAFMCRLRMPNSILDARQFAGLADLAEKFGGGYVDVTTRANLQVREIAPRNAPDLLMGIQELGLTSRGAGADNIRNITGGPTAGIDPHELIDTRPLCRALHHHILNHRELYGLPRKFNIAFDGGGSVGVLEDTNDIGFTAVQVDAGKAVPPGIWFRVQFGGITGHGDFARDAGVVVLPEQCVAVADAVVRVFIANGNRTDRKKARLKYVLDDWGHERFLAEVEKLLPAPLSRLPLSDCKPRRPWAKHGHIGIHAQKQEGLRYVGVVLPVGRLAAAQMRGLAAVASQFGSGTLRLTVWQNLLISDVPDEHLAAATRAIETLGLGVSASSVRGAMVACTGNTGCKFSATDTKGQAVLLADYLDREVKLDLPINIHLTGCPHSCAQHNCADVGLLGTKIGEDGIEGYHVSVGGGAAGDQAIAREIWRDVPFAELPARMSGMLRSYMARRSDAEETFHAFTARHSVAELIQLFAAAG